MAPFRPHRPGAVTGATRPAARREASPAVERERSPVDEGPSYARQFAERLAAAAGRYVGGQMAACVGGNPAAAGIP